MINLPTFRKRFQALATLAVLYLSALGHAATLPPEKVLSLTVSAKATEGLSGDRLICVATIRNTGIRKLVIQGTLVYGVSAQLIGILSDGETIPLAARRPQSPVIVPDPVALTPGQTYRTTLEVEGAPSLMFRRDVIGYQLVYDCSWISRAAKEQGMMDVWPGLLTSNIFCIRETPAGFRIVTDAVYFIPLRLKASDPQTRIGLLLTASSKERRPQALRLAKRTLAYPAVPISVMRELTGQVCISDETAARLYLGILTRLRLIKVQGRSVYDIGTDLSPRAQAFGTITSYWWQQLGLRSTIVSKDKGCFRVVRYVFLAADRVGGTREVRRLEERIDTRGVYELISTRTIVRGELDDEMGIWLPE